MDIIIIILNTASETSPLAEQFDQRKFTRRDDLTTTKRMEIAVEALHASLSNTWGVVTDIAKKITYLERLFIRFATPLRTQESFSFQNPPFSPTCYYCACRLSSPYYHFDWKDEVVLVRFQQ